MALSVIIPAFNEENAISDTLKRLRDTLSCTGIDDFQIIVVDDGSVDKTRELAEAQGTTVVRHMQTLGYGRSIKDGILAAKHDTIAITDADGTYPLGEIQFLLEDYERGFDMVVGQRTGREFAGSLFKSPLREILRWLVEFSAGRKIPDINSGFRVFSKRDAMRYFNQLCDTFSFTTSLTLAYMMNGKCIHYRKISYFARIGKSKIRIVRDSLRTLQYIVQAILYYNPMKIFIVMCMVTLSMSICSLVIGVVFGLASGFSLGIGGLLATLLIFSLGLLADLLKQIMNK